MKAVLLTALAALALQFVPPPPPPPPLLPQLGQQLQVDPSVRGTIQGIVKSPDSSDGIPDVDITVTAAQTTPGVPGAELHKVTDRDGKFSFTDLPGGRYTVRAQRDGYFPAANPDIPALLTPTFVAVITKEAPDFKLTIPMIAGGTISGRLSDAQGRPAIGVSLSVLRVVYQDGRKTLTAASTGTLAGFSNLPGAASQVTNDRGEYRLFWFPPGEYFLRAETSNGLAALRATSTTTVPLPTFYPGTRDFSRAIPVVVSAGKEMTGIDFRVEYAKAFTVSGTITLSVPGGTVLPNGQLSRAISSFFVVSQGADPSDRIPLTSGSSSSTDQVHFNFQLRGIAPGSYYVYPVFSDGQTSSTSRTASYYSARIPVEVIDSDVTGVVGEIHRYPDLTVRLILKGNPPANGALPTTRIQLRPEEAMGSLVTSGTTIAKPPGADGSVVFPNLFPAKYKVLVPLPANYYLADIRQGATSLYKDGIVTVSSDQASPIEVTLSTGGGQIRGTVQDSRGQPVSARIALVPQPAYRQNILLYKHTVALGVTGQFALPAIAPGEYKIFAFEELPTSADENAEFLSKYENRGRSITVAAGSTVNDLRVDLIPKDSK